MDFEASTELNKGAVPVFGIVQDLETYPRWFSIVDRAEPLASDERAAWDVDLAARFGPVKRTKRVRMVRSTVDLADHHVRFERVENDGKRHSPWVLEAWVADLGHGGDGSEPLDRCRLRVHVHYGGFGWFPGLDLLLREEAKRAGARLDRLLTAD